MAVFERVDWGRFDFEAIVGGRGVVSIRKADADQWKDWLSENSYTVVPFDFSDGWQQSTPRLGRLFQWEENFGYAMRLPRPGLDALNDGFEFDVPSDGGLVFYITGGDTAHAEDTYWFLGLLSIASAYSLQQIALGKRFFSVLEVVDESPLIGIEFDKARVMWPPRPIHKRH